MKEIYILFINDGNIMGGAEKSLVLLLANMKENKFKYMVLCDAENKELIAKLKENHIEYAAIDFPCGDPLKVIPRIIKTLFLVNRIIIKNSINILYANTVRAQKFSCLYKFLFFSRVKSIWHIRDMGAKWRWFDKIIVLMFTDKMIAVSNAVAEYHRRLFKLYKNFPISIVYNASNLSEGNDKNDTAERFIKKFKLDGSILIGCAGRIASRKGYEYVIKALPVILKEFNDVKLLILGDPDKSPTERYYIKFLKNLVEELNLNEKVLFTGQIENIIEIFPAFKLVVVPSIENDPCPRVVIETMACGIPVIGTRVGGIPELIDDNKSGYLVEPENTADITKKVIFILSNGDMAKNMGMYGREAVIKRFSIENYVGGVERIIEKL